MLGCLGPQRKCLNIHKTEKSAYFILYWTFLGVIDSRHCLNDSFVNLAQTISYDLIDFSVIIDLTD